MTRPHVEILYFKGCPHYQAAQLMVRRAAAALRLEATIDLVEVTDAEAAAELRFLGSPTVRVSGRDVEPGADDRRDFVLSCRVYRTSAGVAGQPDEAWVRDALARTAA